MTASASPATATSRRCWRPGAPRWRPIRKLIANFYRLAGFRFLGKRAVRVDILERLADLIRPALQWEAGRAGRASGSGL